MRGGPGRRDEAIIVISGRDEETLTKLMRMLGRSGPLGPFSLKSGLVILSRSGSVPSVVEVEVSRR